MKDRPNLRSYIFVPSGLLIRLEDFARENGLTTSEALQMAISELVRLPERKNPNETE
jgi:hypothetical protein